MASSLFFINKKIFPVAYEWKNILIIFFSTIALYSLSVNFNLSFIQKILMCLSYPLISIFCGVIRIRYFHSLFSK
jgi:hypothetical protein